jgi:putative peptide zinc metalloprotease protein
VLEIVLPDHSRHALVGDVTIGRGPENAVRLADASVSRLHARISADGGESAVLEDAGSSYGTWLDERRVVAPVRLCEGSRIRVGNLELVVDRRRGKDESLRTIVVPAAAATTVAARFGGRPRVRSGYALKRLEVAEDDRRWVLESVRSGRFVRMSDLDAELFALLDGSSSFTDLMRAAEGRQGATGPARLALLIATLGERGFLTGTEAAADAEESPGRLARLGAARKLVWPGAGDVFERLYARGGRRLLTVPGLAVLGALATAGVIVFAYLVVGRYGTPFVVARKVGIGGIVFLLGRLAVAAIHELAHGLVLASFGRRVREAGVKLVLIFPYVYVDTSEGWFEPRRRRIAVSAAGPVSDLSLGGTFSLCSFAAGPGALRDVFFQLAFGAYVGAFFNLNPAVERDGHQIAADLLREPALRRRAVEQLRRRLAGDRGAFASRAVAVYAGLVAVWSLAGAAITAALSLRYAPMLGRLLPGGVVSGGLAVLWAALLVPFAALVGPPLWRRLRG